MTKLSKGNKVVILTKNWSRAVGIVHSTYKKWVEVEINGHRGYWFHQQEVQKLR